MGSSERLKSSRTYKLLDGAAFACNFIGLVGIFPTKVARNKSREGMGSPGFG